MTEAFPNAEYAFRDALNHPIPFPSCSGSSGRPNYPRPRCTSLHGTHRRVPTQFDKFAGALVELRNSKGITVAGGDRLGNPAQLKIADALYDQLLGLHISTLVVAIDPSVTHILSTHSSLPYPSSTGFVTPTLGAVAHGLDHNPKRYRQVSCSWSMPSTPYERVAFVWPNGYRGRHR